MKRVLKFLFLSFFCCSAALILFAGAYVLSLDDWKDFQPSTLAEMDHSLVLMDRNDEEYLVLSAEENRLSFDYEELPEHVKNAFIAIEDARFYEHKGIDPVRMGGALLSDIRSMSLKEGASTITQQLIKLSALSGEKTLSRKTNEILMAIRTERYYSKDEILALYLNKVYFGRGAYGLEAAARSYFGIAAKELSPAQAAALAGIIQSPSNYAPHLHPDACKTRRDLVLREMYENGFLSMTEYEKAKSEELVIEEQNEEYVGGFYTDHVLNCASEILGVSIDRLLREGYVIETALDVELQQYCEGLMKDDESFPEPAEDGSEAECAVVIEESRTGLLCALIGGREHTAQLGFSRAVHMKRQPGSAIKPILVFTPAIEYGGYMPTSFLLDQPMRFTDYSPRNSGSSFRGWVTLRNTIAYSVNIPTVSLFEEMGIETCKEYAESVGIPFAEKDNHLSLSLGGFTEGVTPLSLAGAYQPYANEGKYIPSSPIRRILDSDGNVLYDHEFQEDYQVISRETAFLMASMLRSSVEYGTAKNLYLADVPLCAKTGTTTYEDAVNNKDAWISAFNPDYVICTWMGFDKTDTAHSLKKGETGGTYPALLTKKIYAYLYENKSAPDFIPPNTIKKVWLDAETLENDFVAAAVPASAQGSVAEYFMAQDAPPLYENDTRDEVPTESSFSEFRSPVE